ncbi:MAG: sugar-transfer associated ATP-grasp domain-containing protein [Bacilli bacterium]|nr:sugar-transfer associated ATP-grasp domain-containing protein [Bacilli bacterium]MDD4406666.1 sugar-transfer associated ATP-grasp domain-containing protein [Bacilli bacterium]
MGKLKIIKNIDFKNMFKIIKKISNKTNKNYFFTVLDVIYSAIIYGAGYYDYQEFEFYNLNHKLRKTYLTRVKNNKIIRKYNDKNFFYKLDNKLEFNKLFKEYIKRDYLFINNDNYKVFQKFVNKHQEFIVKPLDGEGGYGIQKMHINNKTNLKKLFHDLLSNNQVLIEEYINQHKKITELYNNSVNTLRLFTFYDGTKTYVLNSVFKLGNGGVIDNFCSGGMYTFVDDNGKIIVPAIDQNDNIYYIHPITKKDILGFVIPMYQEACNLVKEAAILIPEIKYIGWDVAITNKGPLIIEGNSFPGVFQIKPSLNNKKEGLIPKYQKVMKIK